MSIPHSAIWGILTPCRLLNYLQGIRPADLLEPFDKIRQTHMKIEAVKFNDDVLYKQCLNEVL